MHPPHVLVPTTPREAAQHCRQQADVFRFCAAVERVTYAQTGQTHVRPAATRAALLATAERWEERAAELEQAANDPAHLERVLAWLGVEAVRSDSERHAVRWLMDQLTGGPLKVRDG